MSKQSQHVIPSATGWRVLRTGAVRASSTHPTQQEAIAAARRIAENQGAILYIHGRDGRIMERNVFGNDPRLPKE